MPDEAPAVEAKPATAAPVGAAPDATTEVSAFDARAAVEAGKVSAREAMMARVNARAAELKGEKPKAAVAAKPAEKATLPASVNGTVASAANAAVDGVKTEEEKKADEKKTDTAPKASRAKQRIITLAREKAELSAEIEKLKATSAAAAPLAATDDDVKARLKSRPGLAFEAGLDLKTLAEEWIAQNPAPDADATKAEIKAHAAKQDRFVEDLAKKQKDLETENAELRKKVEAGEAKSAESQAAAAEQKWISRVTDLIAPDKERWEICNREPTAPRAILNDARILANKAIAGDIDVCDKFDVSEEEIASKAISDATADKILKACADAAEKLYEAKGRQWTKASSRDKGTSEKTPDAGQRPRPNTITPSLSSGIVPQSPNVTQRVDPMAKLLEKTRQRNGRAQA